MPLVVDSLELVLNATSTYAHVIAGYVDASGVTVLPFACQLDISVRIEPTASTDASTGRLVTFGDRLYPNGSYVCSSTFTYSSGVVACKQAGYDVGRAVMASAVQGTVTYLNSSGGVSTMGQNCVGNGA